MDFPVFITTISETAKATTDSKSGERALKETVLSVTLGLPTLHPGRGEGEDQSSCLFALVLDLPSLLFRWPQQDLPSRNTVGFTQPCSGRQECQFSYCCTNT